MSKILLFLESNISARQKIELSKVTSKSLGDINASIAAKTPFLDYTLFMNDYPEIAERLKNAMAILGEDEGHFFEVEDDFQFHDLDGIRLNEISHLVLSNILESANEYN